METLAVKILGYIGVLATGWLISKIFNDKKLDKLQEASDKKLEKLIGDLKAEIRENKTPIEEMSKSVLDLDRSVVKLVEKLSAQTDDVDEVKNMLEGLFDRVRKLETHTELNGSKINDLSETCRARHKA